MPSGGPVACIGESRVGRVDEAILGQSTLGVVTNLIQISEEALICGERR